jgi:phosphonate transport system substrate-binding protein
LLATDSGDEIPRLWVRSVLQEAGVEVGEGGVRVSGTAANVSQAVLPVFFGQVEACVVPVSSLDTMAELNPQLRRDLKVLATSPAFCQGPICVRKDVLEEWGHLLSDVLTTLHLEPEGRQLLTLFRIEQLVPFDDAYLEPTARLLEELTGAAGREMAVP